MRYSAAGLAVLAWLWFFWQLTQGRAHFEYLAIPAIVTALAALFIGWIELYKLSSLASPEVLEARERAEERQAEREERLRRADQGPGARERATHSTRERLEDLVESGAEVQIGPDGELIVQEPEEQAGREND